MRSTRQFLLTVLHIIRTYSSLFSFFFFLLFLHNVYSYVATISFSHVSRIVVPETKNKNCGCRLVGNFITPFSIPGAYDRRGTTIKATLDTTTTTTTADSRCTHVCRTCIFKNVSRARAYFLPIWFSIATKYVKKVLGVDADRPSLSPTSVQARTPSITSSGTEQNESASFLFYSYFYFFGARRKIARRCYFVYVRTMYVLVLWFVHFRVANVKFVSDR